MFIAEVGASLQSDTSSLKDRFKNMRVARLTQATLASGSRSSFSSGPVLVDSLPPPGYSPHHAQGTSNRDDLIPLDSPSTGFGGIKFSLDPGIVTNSHATRSSRPSTTHRAHTAAAKLNPVSQTSAPSTRLQDFSSPPTIARSYSAAPSGFFRYALSVSQSVRTAEAGQF